MSFGAASSKGSGTILTPMPGRVVKVNGKAGDTVEAGATLMILEAMKMEVRERFRFVLLARARARVCMCVCVCVCLCMCMCVCVCVCVCVTLGRLQHAIKAPFNGTIKEIRFAEGGSVQDGDVLVIFDEPKAEKPKKK